MAAPPGSTPAGSMTYKGKTIPLYQKPLNDGTGRIGIYDGNGTRYRTISGTQDFLDQVTHDQDINVGKQLASQTKWTVGKGAIGFGLTRIPLMTGGGATAAATAGGGAAAVAGGEAATAAAATAGVASAGAIGLSLLPVTLIAGGLFVAKLFGSNILKPDLTKPIYGAEPGHLYGSPPGQPGYRKAKFQGAQPVSGSLIDSQLQQDRKLERQLANPTHAPEDLFDPKNHKQLREWNNNWAKLDRELRQVVSRGAPTGTLYPNYTSVTRYTDEAHGSKPVTYSYPGPVGEFVMNEHLPGGLGLTNLGRVLHKDADKWGVPVDTDGDKFRATMAAYYAARTYRASNQKMSIDQAIAIGQEKANRDWVDVLQNTKPKAVAHARYDNSIDPKTSALLMRAANARQNVWNQSKSEWQDPLLGLRAEQKPAQQRWELTRPINQTNAKPKQGSVVQMIGPIRPAEQAVYKNGPGGLAWRDVRTNAVIDQQQAQRRWQATRPDGHKNDQPHQNSVVDLAPGQWQSFTDKYGRAGYQRVGKNGQIFETRYNVTGTNQPPSENIILPAYDWPQPQPSAAKASTVRPAGPGRSQTVGTKEEPAQPGRQPFQARGGSQTDDRSLAVVGPATITSAQPTYNETELHKYDEIESQRLAASRTPPPAYQGAGIPVSSDHFVDKKGRLNTITTLASGAKIQQVEGSTPYRISGPTPGVVADAGQPGGPIGTYNTAKNQTPSPTPARPADVSGGTADRIAEQIAASAATEVSMPPETKPLAEVGEPLQPNLPAVPPSTISADNRGGQSTPVWHADPNWGAPSQYAIALAGLDPGKVLEERPGKDGKTIFRMDDGTYQVYNPRTLETSGAGTWNKDQWNEYSTAHPVPPAPPEVTNPAALYSGNSNDNPIGEPTVPMGVTTGATDPTQAAGAQNPLTTPPQATPTETFSGLGSSQSETPGIFKHGRWLEM